MFVSAQFTKVLKEDDMSTLVTDTQPSSKHSTEGETWMQITFTMDPEHYRALRARAEEEGLSVPGFVRESVMDSLEAMRPHPAKIESVSKRYL